MFQHQGPGRSDRQNRIVAGYLAFVGGFVNSTGFVLIGSFTSHVTGNVGRLANDLAYRQYGAAWAALPMIVAFFAGAFVASMALESNVFGRTAEPLANFAAPARRLLASAWRDSPTLCPVPLPRPGRVARSTPAPRRFREHSRACVRERAVA
jgi:Protein of unknown function (DUF1275)